MTLLLATVALVARCVLVAAASRVGEHLLTRWETGRGEYSADREGVA